MIINYSDALLIQSIFHSEKEKQGAKLTHIIAYADYINHSIMTFSEFELGLTKLIALDLVIEDGEVLLTTDKFKDWWNVKFASKKRRYPLKELDQIILYLKQLSHKLNELLNRIKMKSTEGDFNKAILSYIKQIG